MLFYQSVLGMVAVGLLGQGGLVWDSICESSLVNIRNLLQHPASQGMGK